MQGQPGQKIPAMLILRHLGGVTPVVGVAVGCQTGIRIGMKPAGGIRTAKQALAYLVMLKETLGDDWLTPDLFRFGASTLVNDVLMQIVKTVDGNYQSSDYFSLP